jgi:hypothetical protein
MSFPAKSLKKELMLLLYTASFKMFFVGVDDAVKFFKVADILRREKW